MPFSTITGTGFHQPERVVTNDDLAKLVNTDDAWIRRRTGIRTRRIAAADEQVSDLAAPAARMAMRSAGLPSDAIDMVIVATCSARDRCPSTAAEVAGRLGLTNAVCFDINNACAGFSTALNVAENSIRADQSRHALVIGAEKMSDVTDWSDRSSCILLGDGAGAVIVSPGERRGIHPAEWGTDPRLRDNVTIRGSWEADFTQNGASVFRWATSMMASTARKAVARAGLDIENIGAFIAHQANLRIIEPIVDDLGLGHALIARDVVESGNTSAASIPLALSKLSHSGELPAGVPTLLLSFGGGLSWSSQVILSP